MAANIQVQEYPVIVTTSLYGILFGYITQRPETIDLYEKNYIELKRVRMCCFYDKIRGILDLAVSGPNSECEITPQIAWLKIKDVNAVFPCSEQAAKEWEQGYFKYHG